MARLERLEELTLMVLFFMRQSDNGLKKRELKSRNVFLFIKIILHY